MNPHFVSRPLCELCGSARTERLLARAMTDPVVFDFLESYYRGRIDKSLLDGAEYSILRCRDCGFAWQAQVLGPELMRRLYGEWISMEDSLDKKRLADIALFRGYAAQVERIAGLVGKAPHETGVLDYGMGWGYWCRMAQAFGYQVVGYEVEPNRIDFARRLGIQTVSDLRTVPEGAFDYINAEQVFEHITQPLQAASGLCRVLKPRGVLRIAVPDAAPLLREPDRPDWKAAKDALHPLEHINAYTRATLERLGASAGLEHIPPQKVGRGGMARLRAFLSGDKPDRGEPRTALLFRKP